MTAEKHILNRGIDLQGRVSGWLAPTCFRKPAALRENTLVDETRKQIARNFAADLEMERNQLGTVGSGEQYPGDPSFDGHAVLNEDRGL